MSVDNLSGRTIRLDLPASLQYLNVLGACLEAVLTHVHHKEGWETVSYNVQLAVHEICVNIVLHAYAGMKEEGRIEIVISLGPHSEYLTVSLYDNGMPFDETNVQPPPLGLERVHGYGLFLVRNLVDSVDYQRQSGRNRWNLKKYFPL